GDWKRRNERDGHEQETRRDVREHHRVHEPDALREPRRAQVRSRVHDPRAEEQEGDRRLTDAEALEEEVREHRRRQKTSTESVEREERAHLGEDSSGPRRSGERRSAPAALDDFTKTRIEKHDRDEGDGGADEHESMRLCAGKSVASREDG